MFAHSAYGIQASHIFFAYSACDLHILSLFSAHHPYDVHVPPSFICMLCVYVHSSLLFCSGSVCYIHGSLLSLAFLWIDFLTRFCQESSIFELQGYLLSSCWSLVAALGNYYHPLGPICDFRSMLNDGRPKIRPHYWSTFPTRLGTWASHDALFIFIWCTFSRLCFSSILGGLKALKLMLLGGGRHGWSVLNSCWNWVGQVFIQGWFLELFRVPSRLTFWGHFGSQILHYRHFGATLGGFGGSKTRVWFLIDFWVPL